MSAATVLVELLRCGGVVLLLGGISAWYVLGGRRGGTRAGPSPALAGAGALSLVAAGIIGGSDDFRTGAEILLPLLTFGVFLLGTRRNSAALVFVAALVGAELLGLEVAYSHAAAEPGVLPLVANAVHWVIAAGWAGAAVHLAILQWPGDTASRRAAADSLGRYARLSLTGLVLAALTGGLLGFVHIHNADALTATAYGSVYAVKLGLVAVLATVAALTQIRIAAIRRSEAADYTGDSGDSDRRIVRALATLRIEAVLLVALVGLAGLLAVKTPPALAPFLNPQTWSVAAGDRPFTVELQPVAGQLGRARLEIAPADPGDALPDGTLVEVLLSLADGSEEPLASEGLPVGPSEFLAETIFPMPGEWRLDVRFLPPDGPPIRAGGTVAVPGPPLEDDMRAYLSTKTIFYHGANVMTFVVGLLLVGAAIWGYRLGVTGRAPGWLVVSSFAGAALGGLLVLSVSFVKTYPSSFRDNPVPYTVESIGIGDARYREHCADCHGLAGRGDSAWAFENRGSKLPDLSAPHMDTHTDGEIYWWIRYGIPSLEMPGFDDELTEDETWAVINFVRSLRHGMPPQQ